MAQVCATCSDAFGGSSAVGALFDKYPDAAEGKFLYMSSLMQTSQNPEEHFMYIKAAVDCGNLTEASPSPIPSLCTHLIRAGIEWRRCRHAVCMTRPCKEPHHSGQAEP